MWFEGWRERTWGELDQPWDLVVIGGGVTGAGIFREAVAAGLRTLLVEQGDFASGTSSRSSKLVHGGLRYLASGQLRLMWHAVREREHLLEAAPGLVEPLKFHLAIPPRWGMRWALEVALAIYDVLSKRWSYRYLSPAALQQELPDFEVGNTKGVLEFGDAQTDDARLVLRLLREGVQAGGCALNYAAVEDFVWEDDRVVGLRLRERESNDLLDIRARVIVNAAGPWVDQLRKKVGAPPKMRPLRGSHLVFSRERLPMKQALSLLHPRDRRPVMIYPWEGATIVGTTDVDHKDGLRLEPSIAGSEVAYLMEAVTRCFPTLELDLHDVIATWSGVRPVVHTGRADPSKESRDHVVWLEKGLMTVTGGKLTTYRLIARDALKAISAHLPGIQPSPDPPSFANIPPNLPLEIPVTQRRRLLGRLGHDALPLVQAARGGELSSIPGADASWAELRWAARAEGVVHLSDLLLRRVRLGLLLPQGGAAFQPQIRSICQQELGWDDARWTQEWDAYQEQWHAHYSLPPKHQIPSWHTSHARAA